MDSAQLNLDSASFYKSVNGILSHILFSNDMFFLGLYGNQFPEHFINEENPFPGMDENKHMKTVRSIKKKFSAFLALRKSMDILLGNYIGHLKEYDLFAKTDTYKSGGSPCRQELCKYRNEVGAACAAYYRGEKVVDIWAGLRDKKSGARWKENTMVMVSSTTKGMASIAIILAIAKGYLDFDEKISHYWPEFAQGIQ